jgi:hypothetical protein
MPIQQPLSNAMYRKNKNQYVARKNSSSLPVKILVEREKSGRIYLIIRQEYSIFEHKERVLISLNDKLPRCEQRCRKRRNISNVIDDDKKSTLPSSRDTT